MTDHSIFLAQKRFGSLDGLRAISILGVIWHHTAPPWVGPVLGRIGANGVTLFFAISGFLITTLLLRERERNGDISLKAFYIRRTTRIMPLYYGVLLLYIVIVSVLERRTPYGLAFFDHLVYYATYTSNYFVPLEDGRVIFYFAWSLAAEEQFYLMWPPLLRATGTASRARTLLFLILTGCIAGELLGNRFITKVPLAIVGGALLAVVLHSKKGFRLLETVLGRAWSCVVFAVLLVLVLTVLPAPRFVIHLLFVGLVGSCVVHEKHLISPLLSVKPIVYIGSISYGMYMLHMLCKNAAVKMLNAAHVSTDGLLLFFVTLAMGIVAAGLSFKYYESFFLKLGHKYQRRTHRSTQVAAQNENALLPNAHSLG